LRILDDGGGNVSVERLRPVRKVRTASGLAGDTRWESFV
jgi:hypothetical protein